MINNHKTNNYKIRPIQKDKNNKKIIIISQYVIFYIKIKCCIYHKFKRDLLRKKNKL